MKGGYFYSLFIFSILCFLVNQFGLGTVLLALFVLGLFL